MQAEATRITQGRATPPVKFKNTPRRPTTGWEGHRHLRCVGRPVFRSRAAVDLALVLDLSPEVEEWIAVPSPIELRVDDDTIELHVADFFVRRVDGSCFYVDAEGFEEWRAVDPAVEYVAGPSAGFMDEATIRNARGIVSYACMDVPLADQIRLLSRIDEVGAVTLAEALEQMTETYEPVGAVMALAARRVVRLDTRSSVIGPRTSVERFTCDARPAHAGTARRRSCRPVPTGGTSEPPDPVNSAPRVFVASNAAGGRDHAR